MLPDGGLRVAGRRSRSDGLAVLIIRGGCLDDLGPPSRYFATADSSNQVCRLAKPSPPFRWFKLGELLCRRYEAGNEEWIVKFIIMDRGNIFSTVFLNRSTSLYQYERTSSQRLRRMNPSRIRLLPHTLSNIRKRVESACANAARSG